MIRLVSLYGVGDAYLTCALTREFERVHGTRAMVVIKSTQQAVPKMFGLEYFKVADRLVADAENNPEFHASYQNRIEEDATFYVHPHFVNTPVRLDQLTAKPRVSQADVVRALMGLSPWCVLASPDSVSVKPVEKTVMILRNPRSWPSVLPEFWDRLGQRLFSAGWTVTEVSSFWDLGYLFEEMKRNSWVIGPQCGVMSVVIEAPFACKKTLVVRELDGETGAGPFGLTRAFPYQRVETFAGVEHPEVDHYLVTRDNWAGVSDVVSFNAGVG